MNFEIDSIFKTKLSDVIPCSKLFGKSIFILLNYDDDLLLLIQGWPSANTTNLKGRGSGSSSTLPPPVPRFPCKDASCKARRVAKSP